MRNRLVVTAAARELWPEDFFGFFDAFQRWREKARVGLMSYLKSSGEQLAELRKMDLWDLYEAFTIVKAQSDALKQRREKHAWMGRRP